MEHQLTITLPDEVFQPLVEAALRQGRTVEEWAAERLIETLPTLTTDGEAEGDDISRFFGMWHSGDPNFADNERIDADLAREYGRGLDGDE